MGHDILRFRQNWKIYYYRFGFFIFFLLIFLFVYFSNISFREVLLNLKKISLLQVIILSAGYIVISLATIIGKKIILNFLGYKVKFSNISTIHFASVSAHYTTPAKIGYPVTVYLLKRIENIPISISSAVITIELFVSLLITGVIGLVGSTVYLREFAPSFLRGLIFLLVCLILVAFMIYIAYQLSNKIQNIFKELILSAKHLTFTKGAIYIFIQITIQVMASFYLILIAYFFGSILSFWQAMVINSSAFFIGAISMVPMGLGARDLSMIYYLNSFGVASQASLSIAAVHRVISTGFGYIIGLLAIGYLSLKGLDRYGSKIS